MSKILKLLVKSTIIWLVLVCSSTTLRAQCAVQKTTAKGLLKFETPEVYQFLRSDKQYLGVAIKTILSKKTSGDSYHISIKYTSNILGSGSDKLSFKLSNDLIITVPLKFIKKQKNDDIKLITKIYEAALTTSDINSLKQTPLKELTIVGTNKISTIPVNDPSFMQTQISCLQSAGL